MTKQIFEVARSAIPIAGSGNVFPVRRIYCIGRNYAAHAREMGSDPTREPPFFFQKPGDAIQVVLPDEVADHPYPPLTKNYHYEVELVAALDKGGRNIPAGSALDCVFGYAVGFDLTRRDVQARAKEKGHPWDMGKGFDASAPTGELQPVSAIGHPAKGAIWLTVNGERRQNGDLSDMSWKVAEVIANLSTFVRLAPGDLIFTGTPAGVSTVVRGDMLEGHVDGVGDLRVRLV